MIKLHDDAVNYPTLEIDLVTMGTLVMLGRGSKFFVCEGL